MMLRPTGGRGQIDMNERASWWKQLRRAAAESSSPARNWRWMLASLAVGAGLGGAEACMPACLERYCWDGRLFASASASRLDSAS